MNKSIVTNSAILPTTKTVYTLDNFFIISSSSIIMAFRKRFIDWPLPDRKKPVRLDKIWCWFDEGEIVADYFCRDCYHHESIKVVPFTLTWTWLYNFLVDWIAVRFPGREDDDLYQDIAHLAIYMDELNFERGPPKRQ